MKCLPTSSTDLLKKSKKKFGDKEKGRIFAVQFFDKSDKITISDATVTPTAAIQIPESGVAMWRDIFTGVWYNGSIMVSKTIGQGSNPCTPAKTRGAARAGRKPFSCERLRILLLAKKCGIVQRTVPWVIDPDAGSNPAAAQSRMERRESPRLLRVLIGAVMKRRCREE